MELTLVDQTQTGHLSTTSGKKSVPVIDIELESRLIVSGQSVKGNVIIILPESIDIECILLRLIGTAHTEWAEDELQSEGNDTAEEHCVGESKKYSENLEFLSEKLSLKLPCKSDAEDFDDTNTTLFMGTMSGASYRIPFRVKLPHDCPTSFKDHKNYVRYFTEVSVKLASVKVETCLREFCVVGELDIASETVLPIVAEINRKFQFFCCSRGNFHCTITLPRSVYSLGEFIPLKMQICNNSSKYINEVVIRLVKHITIKIRNLPERKHSHSRIIDEIKESSIGPNQSYVREDKKIYVPENIPPTLLNCLIMEIVYELQISVNILKPF